MKRRKQQEKKKKAIHFLTRCVWPLLMLRTQASSQRSRRSSCRLDLSFWQPANDASDKFEKAGERAKKGGGTSWIDKGRRYAQQRDYSRGGNLVALVTKKKRRKRKKFLHKPAPCIDVTGSGSRATILPTNRSYRGIKHVQMESISSGCTHTL